MEKYPWVKFKKNENKALRISSIKIPPKLHTLEACSLIENTLAENKIQDT